MMKMRETDRQDALKGSRGTLGGLVAVFVLVLSAGLCVANEAGTSEPASPGISSTQDPEAYMRELAARLGSDEGKEMLLRGTTPAALCAAKPKAVTKKPAAAQPTPAKPVALRADRAIVSADATDSAVVTVRCCDAYGADLVATAGDGVRSCTGTEALRTGCGDDSECSHNDSASGNGSDDDSDTDRSDPCGHRESRQCDHRTGPGSPRGSGTQRDPGTGTERDPRERAQRRGDGTSPSGRGHLAVHLQ